jgi:translation initiation factor IF-2
MILLVADMQDLKANPTARHGHRARSPTGPRTRPGGDRAGAQRHAHVGDFFICGAVFGKVRAMIRRPRRQIRKAEPSMPVEVLGLESLPEVGDDFQVVTDTAKAQADREVPRPEGPRSGAGEIGRLTLENCTSRWSEGEIKELPIILKADVGGSAEVLTEALQKLSNEKVKVRVILPAWAPSTRATCCWRRPPTQSSSASTCGRSKAASALAEQEKVDIRLHTIIYNLTDEIKRP